MRRWFWHLATRVAMACIHYCATKRAKYCPCVGCYIFANRDRFVADVMRQMAGEKPVDRRPS